ncbi:MAG: hypothetical protein VYE22_29080 [Myxococcota bacterium]|nr:hypothetical protein [Myxococcota bacterium]
MKTKLAKGLRIAAAWMILGAIIACGGDDDDDAPPVAPTPTAPVQPPTPPPTQPATGPQPGSATPNVSLTPGFMPDPQTAQGTAGGSTMANSFDQNCNAGRIPAQPQHNVTLTSNFNNLRVMVNSAHDTTLAIRGPDGTWRCNDDGNGTGLDPLIVGQFNAGTYAVYVGTFTGNTEGYTIGFSELNSVMPSSLPEPPAQ